MRKIKTTLSDRGRRVASPPFTCGTLTKTASYTITEADIEASGGLLVVLISSAAAAVDITLPSAVTYPGLRIRMYKPSGNTNACSFLATGTQTVEGSSAAKRYQNATNELGSATVWSDGANWRASGTKGTWAVNNS